MRGLAILLGVLALAACEQQPAGEPVTRTQIGPKTASAGETLPDTSPAPGDADRAQSACREVRFEEVPLTHCIADPAQHRIRTALAPNSGERMGRIEGWAAGRNEGSIAFVMNGGMYEDDLRPLGYYVEGGERLEEIERGDGTGNFYLKPNGVFFGTGGKWQLIETETFVRTVGTRPEFGTQSGPMLVIGGELHPEIQDNGPSRAIRNGVGVGADGRAHFVISNAPLSFGQLARFFRDELSVPDAMFLDGNISSLWYPASGRMDANRVGPLIVVETIE